MSTNKIDAMEEALKNTFGEETVANDLAPTETIAEDVGLELAITVIRPYRHLRQSVRQHHALLQLRRLHLEGKEVVLGKTPSNSPYKGEGKRTHPVPPYKGGGKKINYCLIKLIALLSPPL